MPGRRKGRESHVTFGNCRIPGEASRRGAVKVMSILENISQNLNRLHFHSRIVYTTHVITSLRKSSLQFLLQAD